MNNIVQNLIMLVIWESVVCLAVLAVRPLIKKKSNKIMRMLWIVVIARFLCPFAIESPLPTVWSHTSGETGVASVQDVNSVSRNASSLENVEMNGVTALGASKTEAQHRIAGKSESVSDAGIDGAAKATASDPGETGGIEQTKTESVVSDQDKTMREQGGNEELTTMTDHAQGVNAKTGFMPIAAFRSWISGKIGQTVIMIFGIIWAIGAFAFLVSGAVRYYMICKSLEEAILVRRWQGYPVKTSEISGVPMSFGVFHPGIYIPLSFYESEYEGDDSEFSVRQKKMILCHETMHLKRHDPLLKVAAFVMSALHWWNPLVWLCMRYINKDIEMACDEAVLSIIGRKNRGEYAETLFRFATKQSGISLMASFGETNAEGRIKNALRYRKPTFMGAILPIILVLGLGGCFAVRPYSNDENRKADQTDQEVGTEQVQKDKLANDASEDKIGDSQQAKDAVKDTGKDTTSGMSADPAVYEAYRKVIDDYIKQEECQYEDAAYDFIYFNDDDIPDLVINHGGYSLFCYVDGKVYTLMDHESDGIGGYKYFDYLERKGTIFTYGNSYAGAIGYHSIWFLNANYEFDKLVFVEDGSLVEEDDPYYQEIQKELAESRGWYFNGERISEEEAKNKFKEYSVDYDVEGYEGKNTIWLRVEKTWDEMKKILGGYDSREQTNDNAVKEQDKDVSSASLYEGFQNGTEKLYFDRFQGNGSGDFVTAVANALDTKKGYTLSEFKKLVCDVYEWPEEETEVYFDDLDCGQDGVIEKAMKIQGPEDAYSNDTIYILKEDAGKLYCTFGIGEFGRMSASFNKAGVYVEGGSGGAVTHSGEKGILDSAGTYHLINQWEEDGNYSINQIEENLVGADEIIKDAFHLGEDDLLIYVTEKIDGKTYAYFCAETVSNDDIYDVLTKAGKTVMHADEVNKLVRESEVRNGYTKELEDVPLVLFD